MPVTANLKSGGPLSVISIAGKVSAGETWSPVAQILDQVRSEGARKVVVNLSGVPFIDSAGLGLLVMNLSKMKAAGGLLRLAEPQDRVQSAIKTTRLTDLFPFFATEQEAINSFSQPAV